MEKKIKIYALSTCIWCQKTIAYFKEKNVKFTHIFVDELKGEESKKIDKEVKAKNPDMTFPTVLIDDKVIIGFKPEEFEKALEK